MRRTILDELNAITDQKLDEEAGLPEEDRTQAHETQRQPGEQQLQREEGDDGHQAVDQRHTDVLKGQRADVRDENGHHQLRELQLSHLTLAQNSHEYHQRQENNRRSAKQNSHSNTIFSTGR